MTRILQEQGGPRHQRGPHPHDGHQPLSFRAAANQNKNNKRHDDENIRPPVVVTLPKNMFLPVPDDGAVCGQRLFGGVDIAVQFDFVTGSEGGGVKKVLLIVIDALTSRVVVPAMEEGRLPFLAELARRGEFRASCTSIFPSITPAATASIVTGRYPVDHGIAGAFWYDEEHRRIAYYGDDFWVLMNRGFGDFFHDYLIKLNFQRLQSDTLFEKVERAGLTAAVVNYMWFRGEVEHEVNVPLMLKLWPGVRFAPRVRGPQVMQLADFVQSPLPGDSEPLVAVGGVSRRFGFHDDTTTDYLRQIFRSRLVPDFTLAYFPNNDFESHNVGPQESIPVLEQVDITLGTLADEYGGIDRLLHDVAVLITGDHSHCEQAEVAGERAIALDEVLGDFRLVPAGETWRDDDELLVCPNMRAVQIYLREGSAGPFRDRVVRSLLSHPQVDQALWAEEHGGQRRYNVVTRERGRLAFWRSAGTEPSGTDAYGNFWIWEGELSAIDATLAPDGRIRYGDYPNALERIAGAFSDVSGDLWATALPGTEFCMPETEVHPGGSHGALHELDSTAPLFAAGVPESVPVPQDPRIIDLAPLCQKILGIDDSSPPR